MIIDEQRKMDTNPEGVAWFYPQNHFIPSGFDNGLGNFL